MRSLEPLYTAAVMMHAHLQQCVSQASGHHQHVQQLSKVKNGQSLCKKNFWNVDIQSRASKPGPMASSLRHVTSMQSPNTPSYKDIRIRPTANVRDLRGEASLENVAAHQRYLEKLQFEMNTLRSWSNSIQDQIMGEAHQVHLQ